MKNAPSRLSRRSLFAGAGTAGVLAATASLLPATRSSAPEAPPPTPAPEKGGGYHLSEHVQRYYQTTRV